MKKKTKKATKKAAPKAKKKKSIHLENPTMADIDNLPIPAKDKEAIKKAVGPLIELQASQKIRGTSEIRLEVENRLKELEKGMVPHVVDLNSCQEGCCVSFTLSRPDKQKITAGGFLSAMAHFSVETTKTNKPSDTMESIISKGRQEGLQNVSTAVAN